MSDYNGFGSGQSDGEKKAERRLYRARDGMLLGVCKGVADYLFLSAGLIRIVVVLTFLASGFWPVGVIYILLGIFLNKSPLPGTGSDATAQTAHVSRTTVLRDLEKRMQGLDGRIRRMEDAVTRSSFDWEERLRRP